MGDDFWQTDLTVTVTMSKLSHAIRRHGPEGRRTDIWRVTESGLQRT